LLENGFSSEILQSSPVMDIKLSLSVKRQRQIIDEGFTHLIFQKVHDEKAVQFAKEAKNEGIKIVYILSDLIETEMPATADFFVVTSEYLKKYFDAKYGTHAIVIEDAIEETADLWKVHEPTKTLQLVWVGHKDNWSSLSIVKAAMDSLDDPSISLKTISNHPDADVMWSLDTVCQEILKGDVGVIPVNDSEWARCKSNNRLTMFMSLGLPVIVSPINAYTRLITSGENGYVADSAKSWVEYIKQLKSYNLRKSVSQKAKSTVLKKYSMENVGRQWIDLIS
jgi:hypothetical protein